MTATEVITTTSHLTDVRPTVIRVKGRPTIVPSADILGRRIIVTGGFLKVAQIFDEELVEGVAVPNPPEFIESLRASPLQADIFTFTQRPTETASQFDAKFEWDNWAVASTSSFQQWWEKLPQESRKNARRAAKKGISVRAVPFDDELVRGIKGIYDETPVRQGKKFWHFGKDLATVKVENETYLERSEFIGAFYEESLIGFIKVICVDQAAILIQILAKNEHHDKRPMNALLTHAMEICERKNMRYLVYGQYVYGKKNDSSLTEFKRRNGFAQIDFPRYFVPLSSKGRVAMGCGLHLGLGNLMPKRVSDLLLRGRSWLAERAVRATARGAGT
ncbi:MAG: hypothetical protein H0U76_07230 [Ktedonobacteraceae bacterium]|nr:hypothetical protein [Ktedonobacteraceae bacterium]